MNGRYGGKVKLAYPTRLRGRWTQHRAGNNVSLLPFLSVKFIRSPDCGYTRREINSWSAVVIMWPTLIVRKMLSQHDLENSRCDASHQSARYFFNGIEKMTVPIWRQMLKRF